MKVKYYPPFSFLDSFLKERGLEIVEDHPQVVHYFGNSIVDLRRIIKDDNPDLLVTHTMSFLTILKYPQVFHSAKNLNEFISMPTIQTNAYRLARQYYQNLGMNKSIVNLEDSKSKGESFKILDLWTKFEDIMLWR